MPDNKDVITFNETVCSHEFGADGCKVPPKTPRRKTRNNPFLIGHSLTRQRLTKRRSGRRKGSRIAP